MANLEADTRRELARLPVEAKRKLNEITNREFKKIKGNMLEKFESHPVTIEIEAGPTSSNSSGTLGGYGNLWSFIGFPENYDPLTPVRSMLEATQLRSLGFDKRGVLSFITTEPTRDDLFGITKISSFRPNLYEGGRSWLDGIETGLSGLGFYLYDESRDFGAKSRSGPAIQLGGGKKSEKAIGGGTGGAITTQRRRYTRISYISSMLKSFRQEIERLKRRRI